MIESIVERRVEDDGCGWVGNSLAKLGVESGVCFFFWCPTLWLREDLSGGVLFANNCDSMINHRILGYPTSIYIYI